MKTKRYWLRGLISGLIIATIIWLFFKTSCVGLNADGTSSCFVGGNVFIPITLLGLIAGFIYGKIKNQKQVGTIMK